MVKRIYCGNLSFQATEDDVRGLFEAHGDVTSVHMVMDRETGRPRGFAFVEMADDAAAMKAIQALDGARHLERNLKVNEAQPREERGGGGGRGFGGGGGGGGGGRGGYGGGGGGGGGYGGGGGGRGGRDRY
jgi:RNA recognition motif-containing protein